MFKIDAYRGMDNAEIFNVSLDGEQFLFDSSDVNTVEVYTSDPNYGAKISTPGPAVVWRDDEVAVRFGYLPVPVGQSYVVNMRFITDDEPNGLVVQQFLVNMMN